MAEVGNVTNTRDFSSRSNVMGSSYQINMTQLALFSIILLVVVL
jgi:hypothetical protein